MARLLAELLDALHHIPWLKENMIVRLEDGAESGGICSQRRQLVVAEFFSSTRPLGRELRVSQAITWPSCPAVIAIFPSISLEGQSFWIVKTAPLPLSRLWWSKFWTGLVPLLVLGEVLVVATNYYLKVIPMMIKSIKEKA